MGANGLPGTAVRAPYFGEAFYRDALPKAQNLQDAFDQAKKAIALRETQEHQKASNPEAYFGSELERVLDETPMVPPSALVQSDDEHFNVYVADIDRFCTSRRR
jgi:hypothetical protein